MPLLNRAVFCGDNPGGAFLSDRFDAAVIGHGVADHHLHLRAIATAAAIKPAPAAPIPARPLALDRPLVRMGRGDISIDCDGAAWQLTGIYPSSEAAARIASRRGGARSPPLLPVGCPRPR